MPTDPFVSPFPASSMEPAEQPSASARLVITARPFRGELQGELHAQVPAQETNGMINMLGQVAMAVLVLLAAPAVLLYLAPRAGLAPAWVAALVAGELLGALIWLLRCRSALSARTSSSRRSTRRSPK
ncbi:hypothetical protein ACOZ38_25870 [Sphaerisporangium viridialbum]|uniref:hypothetical protein n=1 Tax=Sphaerisporangium viridialbum TaxID=46189 RepID=UPI003C75AD6D